MGILNILFGKQRNGWEKVERTPHWLQKASERDEWEGVGKTYRGKHFEYRQEEGEYNSMHGGNAGGKWFRKLRK